MENVAITQERFLNHFLMNTTGAVELRRMTFDPAQGKYVDPEGIVSRDMKTLLAFSTNGGGDIFHGINLRKPGAVNAEKKDIAEASGVGCDVDFKTTNKPAFERALAKFPHKPSVIVDSGNGRHAYWLFKTPLAIESAEQIELAEGISKGIAKHFGGDSTHDVTRILRTPGRENSKYVHKPLCQLLSDDGPRYDIEELKPYWEKPSSPSGKAKLDHIPDALPEKFQTLLAKNRAVAATWKGERNDLKDQTGSGYDMAMADLLVRHDFSDNEIAAILRQMPSGKGAAATEAYLSHTIGKARESLNEKSNTTKQEPLIVTMDGIKAEKVDWLWTNRIPIGRLTLIDGDPGAGKSYLSLAIASAVSKGESLPFDQKQKSPGSVLLMSCEDGYGDTVRPHLDQLGADVSRIAIPNPGRGLATTMLNASFIEQAVKIQGPALLIVDPVIAFAGRRNTDKANDVRELLSPLMGIAEKYALACLVIRHFNKQTDSKAMYRGSGSVDFMAACRSAFIIVESDDEANMRVLAQVKNSLGRKSSSVSFYIDEHGFRWGKQIDSDAEELLAATRPDNRKREKGQLEAAELFLREALANGPMPSSKITAKAEAAGIARRTLWRAKETLSIKASKERGSLTGEWWWRLP